MCKTRLLLLVLVVLASTARCQEQRTPAAQVVSGTWWPAKKVFPDQLTHEEQFSWGRQRVPSGALLIDALAGARSWLVLPVMGGPFKITKLEQVGDNSYRLRIYFDRGNADVEFLVRYEPVEDAVRFNQQRAFMPDGREVDVQGFMDTNVPWYRVGGPGK